MIGNYKMKLYCLEPGQKNLAYKKLMHLGFKLPGGDQHPRYYYIHGENPKTSQDRMKVNKGVQTSTFELHPNQEITLDDLLSMDREGNFNIVGSGDYLEPTTT